LTAKYFVVSSSAGLAENVNTKESVECYLKIDSDNENLLMLLYNTELEQFTNIKKEHLREITKEEYEAEAEIEDE
jgi:hypothetical protein